MLHTPRTLLALSFAAALGVITMDGTPRAAGLAQAPQEPPPATQPPSQTPPPASGQEPAPQQPPQQQSPQQPTFRAGVNFVRVDVIVTGKDGNPVENLTAADFQVTEDGKPQEIETFKFVSISGNTGPGEQAPKEIRTDYDEEAEAAKDDVRLFAIFLDDYHVRRGSSMSVKKPLIHFVQTQLGDRDMVGIMYPLTPVSAVRMTRNRQEIISAIEKFEGRKYDYRPRNEFEDRYSLYPAATVERIRNQVSMGALRSLVLRLGGLREGRKAVVLVSEGYSNILPPQLSDPVAAFPGLGNPSRGNAGVETDERTDFFMNLDIYQELRQVYDSANRSNTTIYALDPRGLTPFEFDINEGVGQETDRRYLQSTGDSLRTLAEETDGRAIVSQNDLEGGLRQVVRDSSAYYLLGYSSTQPRADGKFHEIKVKVSRPGIQLRARRGYWALTEEEMERSMAPPRPSAPPEVTRALGAVSEERRAQFVRTWIGTARGENGMTRVTFAWESVPPVAGSAESRPQASSVQLLAAGAGADRPYFRGRVPETGDGAATAQPAATAATPGRRSAQVTFDAEPGTMQLRLSVEGPEAQVLDRDLREVAVPDLTAAKVGLSTPAVFRASNVREFRAIGADPHAIPTATREFRRTDRLLVRFETYSPGQPAKVTARVLNRAGDGMTDLPVPAPAAGTESYQLDIPLAGLAPGDYLIEIKASDGEGDATELIGVRVTG